MDKSAPDKKRSLLRLAGVLLLSAALLAVGLWAMRLALRALMAPQRIDVESTQPAD